jgi:hypothetical protein
MNLLETIKQKRQEKNLQANKEIVPVSQTQSWSGKNMLDKYIYSEIIWNKKDNNLLFRRYNLAMNLQDECIVPFISSSNIGSYLKTPLIVLKTNWRELKKEKYNLLSYKIEFTNYNHDPFTYGVVLQAIKENGKQICDSFASTNSEFITGEILLENIKIFLKFAESTKK